MAKYKCVRAFGLPGIGGLKPGDEIELPDGVEVASYLEPVPVSSPAPNPAPTTDKAS